MGCYIGEVWLVPVMGLTMKVTDLMGVILKMNLETCLRAVYSSIHLNMTLLQCNCFT